MYKGFDIINNGSTLLELLVMATIFVILGYLLAWLLGMRKLNEYWARININRNEIENFKKAINYDDLLTTISTKLATLEKKYSKLKVPTIDQLDPSAFVTKDSFRNLKIQNHINKSELIEFLELKDVVRDNELSRYLLQSQSENFATKDDIPKFEESSFVQRSELSNFAQKSEIPKLDLTQYALKSELADFITKDSEHLKNNNVDSSEFVKQKELEKFAMANQLQKFALKDDLTSYMKFGDFKNQFNKMNTEDAISGYVKKEDLAPYLKKVDRPDPVDITTFTSKNDFNKLNMKISELNNLKQTLEMLQSESQSQRSIISELKERLADLPVKKKQVVELDSKGIPKKTITHLLSIKDIVATKSIRDDLQEIKGIGEFIEKKINALGIFTFKQISKLNKDDVQLITEAIKFFPGRIIRDDWVGQAKSKVSKLPTFD